MLNTELKQRALTALQKAFGVTVTDVVTYLTSLIMSAVLSSQKLAEHIKSAIVEYHDALPAPTAPAMTFEEKNAIITEAMTKASESASSGTTAAIGQQLTAMLTDPDRMSQILKVVLSNPVQLANALANNEEACATLQKANYRASLAAKDEANQRRMENIAAAISAIFNERHGGESGLKDEDIAPLVHRVEDEGVVRGKQARNFVDAIGTWLVDQENKMAETISAMAYANTPPATIEGYAKQIISLGVTVENTDAIRKYIENDKVIKLKK